MRKSVTLLLVSMMSLVHLASFCLAEEKTASLDILMRYSPFFGVVLDTEEFTYVGIYYPGFIYEEKDNRMRVEFEKIDEGAVKFVFKLDCPPFIPLEKQIQVKEAVFTAIDPENYSRVKVETIYAFGGIVGEEPIFGQAGESIEEWIASDWTLQMPKSEDIPLGPDEREDSIDKFNKATLAFYPSLHPFLATLSTLEAKILLEAVEAANKLKLDQALEAINLAYKEASPWEPLEIPDERQAIIRLPFSAPRPDECSFTIDVPFVQFLKKELIEPNLITLMRRLPFPRNRKKAYMYVYLPAPDRYRVVLRYESDPELGLKRLRLPSHVPQLKGEI